MKSFLKLLFPCVGLGLLVFVWSVSITGNGGLAATFAPGDSVSLTYNFFRLAGLTAFTLVSFQLLTGPYLKLWEHLYGPRFYLFHAYEGLVALLFATLHPVLLFTHALSRDISYFALARDYPYQYYFGPIAWLLLVMAVTTAASHILMSRPWFRKQWHIIHLANYLVFASAFYHSFTIGADLVDPTSFLRPLWWFFAAVALIGLVYRRIIRVVQEKDTGLA